MEQNFGMQNQVLTGENIMFTHVRVASSDLEKSRAFYDATLATLGIPAGAEIYGMVMYQHAGNRFGVGKPFEGAPTYSNGGTIGFAAADTETVDRFHAVGLANGGTCEGKPGPRGENVYGAYVRDPDGNKICAIMFKG
jgi:catechol 2,3-dioxygenase-like lactoylglutathione lyase family enzyme